MSSTYLLHPTFPQTGKFGRYNRVIIDSIIAAIEARLPTKCSALFVDTTFIGKNPDDNTILSILEENNPEKIVLFGFLDPSLPHSFEIVYKKIKDQSWPDCNSLKDFYLLPYTIKQEILDYHKIDMTLFSKDLKFQKSLNKNYVEIGCIDESLGIRIDLCSIIMADIFQNANRFDVSFLGRDIIPWVCYQFKPHPHRQYLAFLVKQKNIFGNGIITLGDSLDSYGRSSITIPGLSPMMDPSAHLVDYIHEFAGKGVGTNDPLSLGDKLTWQRSFLNIVSENSCDDQRLFVTEKTWKPIVGMRPFVIYGNPGLYPWLESVGFDTFEDLWVGINLRDSPNYQKHCEKITKIIEHVNSFSEKQIIDLYNKIFHRLEHNRDLFFRYADQQKAKISNIVEELENFGFFSSL